VKKEWSSETGFHYPPYLTAQQLIRAQKKALLRGPKSSLSLCTNKYWFHSHLCHNRNFAPGHSLSDKNLILTSISPVWNPFPLCFTAVILRPIHVHSFKWIFYLILKSL
jgi:hypothetical protein